MNILITGSKGFIGKNIQFFLKEKKNIKIFEHTKKKSIKSLKEKLVKADLILHLAGENRSSKIEDYKKNNIFITSLICEVLYKNNIKTPIIFSSTTQFQNNNIYGKSKKKCEEILIDFKKKNNSIVNILRLPNVYGKWSKPNYNSVVATFCHNLSRNLNLRIDNSKSSLNLLYIDDLMNQIFKIIQSPSKKIFPIIENVKKTSLGELVKNLNLIKKKRCSIEPSYLKNKFLKNLYSTYISFVPLSEIQYSLIKKQDKRGEFVEFGKFKAYGQVSYFTINPKEERGHHYHHSKVEKFLVVMGRVKCFFKNLNNNKNYVFDASDKTSSVFESIPGWSHVIKNNSNKKVVILVWSNEVFKKEKPDTYKYRINVKN